MIAISLSVLCGQQQQSIRAPILDIWRAGFFLLEVGMGSFYCAKN
jgi:hypothetical protein